ncbi:hypothetical protein B0T25DRAFT_574082 [Lasiosphaeria hispida]|uniref:Uncharacterized protein n=1 Tax=Lasiosphaeria hispida TaxID=260671 RepID=A0AAJ0M8E4_9PEZI|nr:hypothetical protein B0T25DRAFT_574082 [Lasiosphaeria hispida]
MAPKQQNPESVSSKASWVFVMGEDQFTKDRTPQYNDVNESQAQMSADRAARLVGQQPFGNAMSVDEDGPSTVRKTASNTTETQTDHSFESQVGLIHKTTAATPRTADRTPKPSLSESALLLLNVGQPQGHPFSVHTWLASTGGGRHVEESISGSMCMSAGTGKTKHSTASSISLGYAPVSEPTAMDHELEGCGARFWED